MKKQQLYPEIRKDLTRDDIVRALIVQPELAIQCLDRVYEDRYSAMPENIYALKDVLDQFMANTGTTDSVIKIEYGHICEQVATAMPDMSDFSSDLVALQVLGDMPWSVAKTTQDWRNLPLPVSKRISTHRAQYMRIWRDLNRAIVSVFHQGFTGGVFVYGQLVSFFASKHGVVNSRYPVGGVMNPLLKEYSHSMIESSPNYGTYRAALELLRDYGPTIFHWKDVPLTSFRSFYSRLRNLVFEDLDTHYVIKVVESGIAKEIFEKECVEIAVARKFQNYRALRESIPLMRDDKFLQTQKTNQAGNLSYNGLQEIRKALGGYTGHMKELVGILNASVSAEIFVASSRS